MCELPMEEILVRLLLRSLKGAHVNLENSDLIIGKCTSEISFVI